VKRVIQILSLVIVLLFLVLITQASYSVHLSDIIDDKKEKISEYAGESITKDFKIETLNTEIKLLEQDVDYWKNLYYNYEPKTVYINTTEYETIYRNRYVDNAVFDVNRDGRVNYDDSAEVLWYIKRGVSLIEDWVFSKYGNPYEKLYDVNADGVVDFVDVELVWDYSD